MDLLMFACVTQVSSHVWAPPSPRIDMAHYGKELTIGKCHGRLEIFRWANVIKYIYGDGNISAPANMINIRRWENIHVNKYDQIWQNMRGGKMFIGIFGDRMGTYIGLHTFSCNWFFLQKTVLGKLNYYCCRVTTFPHFRLCLQFSSSFLLSGLLKTFAYRNVLSTLFCGVL